MKIIYIIYNPLSDTHYAVCEKNHKYFCGDSIKAKTLEEVSEIIKRLETNYRKRKVEFIIDKNIPEENKKTLENLIISLFKKSIYFEDLSENKP